MSITYISDIVYWKSLENQKIVYMGLAESDWGVVASVN